MLGRTLLDDKEPLEILGHYRTDAHLVEEYRIKMETPGLPLYDKHCNELTGMALKYAKDWAKREFPVAPRLGDYYLRVGQLEQPEGATASPRARKSYHNLISPNLAWFMEDFWTPL